MGFLIDKSINNTHMFKQTEKQAKKKKKEKLRSTHIF